MGVEQEDLELAGGEWVVTPDGNVRGIVRTKGGRVFAVGLFSIISAAGQVLQVGVAVAKAGGNALEQMLEERTRQS